MVPDTWDFMTVAEREAWYAAVRKPTNVLRAAHKYPATYGSSSTEIDLRCDCHPSAWAGRGLRTGLRGDGDIDRPVYGLHPTYHHELKGKLAMLLEDGTLEIVR